MKLINFLEDVIRLQCISFPTRSLHPGWPEMFSPCWALDFFFVTSLPQFPLEVFLEYLLLPEHHQGKCSTEIINYTICSPNRLNTWLNDLKKPILTRNTQTVDEKNKQGGHQTIEGKRTCPWTQHITLSAYSRIWTSNLPVTGKCHWTTSFSIHWIRM